MRWLYWTRIWYTYWLILWREWMFTENVRQCSTTTLAVIASPCMILKRSAFEIPIWIRLFCFLSILILFISACNCLRPLVYFWQCFYLLLRHLFYFSIYKKWKLFLPNSTGISALTDTSDIDTIANKWLAIVRRKSICVYVCASSIYGNKHS